MSLHSLPVFLRLQGRHVILVGDGEAAAAKRRLLERAGAVVVPEPEDTEDVAHGARIAIVVDNEAAVTRLKARGVLVNAVDRPELCDFTLPAIVDRDPVIVAIGTGGASAGLAAALRQRLETVLPATLGPLARRLHAARAQLRALYPDDAARRRAIGTALAPGAALDPLGTEQNVDRWLAEEPTEAAAAGTTLRFRLVSADPDELTLRQARALAMADRVTYADDVPSEILARARADAVRLASRVPPVDGYPGLTVDVRMA